MRTIPPSGFLLLTLAISFVAHPVQADDSPALEIVKSRCLRCHSTEKKRGELDLSQYSWIVCVGPDEAEKVRAAIGDASATILVANAESGGIPDPYEFGLQGYRDCLALLDVVMPEIARQIASR